jgi:hypothetical protein
MGQGAGILNFYNSLTAQRVEPLKKLKSQTCLAGRRVSKNNVVPLVGGMLNLPSAELRFSNFASLRSGKIGTGLLVCDDIYLVL